MSNVAYPPLVTGKAAAEILGVSLDIVKLLATSIEEDGTRTLKAFKVGGPGGSGIVVSGLSLAKLAARVDEARAQNKALVDYVNAQQFTGRLEIEP